MNKLSLFSGIGGDDLASEWAGIETVCFVEIDKYCQKVLRKHWPDIPIIEDVKDVTKQSIKRVTGRDEIDIIAGGFPCQPRSIAGQRKGREDDRDLWPDMLRIISEFKPPWVVAENPTGILSMDFQEVLSNLESAGYETRSFIIPACAVNAWHRRDRVFIIANSGINGLSRSELRGTSPRPKVTKATKAESLDLPITDINRERQQQPERGFGKFGGWLEYRYWKDNPFKVISRFCRNSHGIPAKMDRIKALGNTVVPQQIYPIYKAIMDIERGY